MRQLTFVTMALLLASGAAHAVVISGNTSITTADPQNAVAVTNNLGSFTFSLNVGGSATVNALTIVPKPGNGTAAYSFSIKDTFNFTLPGSGSTLESGTGSFQVAGNNVSSGTLAWGDGLNGVNIALAGGYVVNVNLSDVDFTNDSPRGTSSEVVQATFKLVSGPVSVPEPASLALLGLGITALAMARRRSN